VSRSGKGRKVRVIIRPVKDDRHDLPGVLIPIREKTRDQITMAKKTKNLFLSSRTIRESPILLKNII
jgi:hypothetical protein